MHIFSVYILSMLIRAWFLSGSDITSWLEDRVELSTPINSHKRLFEGITLLKTGVNPYSGVLFHETPIALHTFRWMYDNLSTRRVNAVFILCDILTAIVLGKLGKAVAKYLLSTQAKNAASYCKDSADLLFHAKDAKKIEVYVQLAYLFHPYIIANCVAKTTTVFSNLIMACFLASMMRGNVGAASLFLSLATYHTFYPVILLFPLVLYFWNGMTETAQLARIVATVAAIFTSGLFLLNLISYKLMNDSWNFLSSTYGFILSVPELTPNMGIFWYFFTEMFEHFRTFFVATFQLNCFVYVLPLSIRFKNEPFLLSFTLIALTAIFKSYPCYGEVGFYTSLLPAVAFHLVPYMKQTFIIANMFLATTMLGPILYQLWIYNGSANSNYFFAITLVFGTAQIFLITDILFAHVKREFYLVNGYKDLMLDKHTNKAEAKLTLK